MDCSSHSDACNKGLCVSGKCYKIPKSGACDDQNPCTLKDSCSGGICKGTPKTCPGNQCNTGLCDKSNGKRALHRRFQLQRLKPDPSSYSSALKTSEMNAPDLASVALNSTATDVSMESQ